MESSREQNLHALLASSLGGTPTQVDALWQSLVRRGESMQRYALVATVPGRVRVVYGTSLSEVADNFRAHSAASGMLYGAEVKGILDLDDNRVLEVEKSFAYTVRVELPKKERPRGSRQQVLYQERLVSGKGKLPDACVHEDIIEDLAPDKQLKRRQSLRKATAHVKGGVGRILGGSEEQFLAQGQFLIVVGDDKSPTLYNVSSLHDVACMLRLIGEKTQQLPSTGVPHLLMDLEAGRRLVVQATPLLRVKSPSTSGAYLYWSYWQK